MKKIVSLLILLLVLGGCTSKVEKINIIADTTSITQGRAIKLSVDTDKEVLWSSSNDAIATVDEEGYVYGHTIGFVEITASLSSNPKIFDTQIVKVVADTGLNYPLTITGNDEVELNKQEKLTVDTDKAVTWESSNPDIATINQEGVVTGLKLGSVKITVTEKDNITKFGEFTLTVVESTTYMYYHTKILSIDEENKTMELLNVPYTSYDDNTEIFQYLNQDLIPISLENLYIGLENVYVKVNKKTGKILKLMLDGEMGFANIRVAIRNSINDIADESTLYHNSINLFVSNGSLVQTYDGEKQETFSIGTEVVVVKSGDDMAVYGDGNLLFTTNKRIIFTSDTPFTVSSITRGYGTPQYSGNLEVSIANDRLLLINDINLELYLQKVVPSEMPSSWNIEALKSQAVAARTYAYMDILNKSHDQYGYTVDDSTKSQVYNNSRAVSSTNQAISETAGLIMMYDGKPVQAYYYSSSSGITASGNEVWIKDHIIEEIPYLVGKNLTGAFGGETISFDYQDEDSMLAFFKTIQMDVPDSSPYHRWLVTMSLEQLTNTIQKNLILTYQSTPESVLTLESGEWVSKSIPEDIGEVTDVYVSQRGSSGVVVSLDIITSTGTYRIYNQYNIRFTIRPRDAGSTVVRYYANNFATEYTGTAYNDSILLSGFFAIEKDGENISFYGGGNGHGVGMSQYGANGYAQQGKTYDQILQTYYSDIDLSDISFVYEPLDIKTYKELLN